MTSRKLTELSINSNGLRETRALRINPPQAAGDCDRIAVSAAKAQQWKAENAEAINISNEYVEKSPGFSSTSRLPHRATLDMQTLKKHYEAIDAASHHAAT